MKAPNARDLPNQQLMGWVSRHKLISSTTSFSNQCTFIQTKLPNTFLTSISTPSTISRNKVAPMTKRALSWEEETGRLMSTTKQSHKMLLRLTWCKEAKFFKRIVQKPRKEKTKMSTNLHRLSSSRLKKAATQVSYKFKGKCHYLTVNLLLDLP